MKLTCTQVICLETDRACGQPATHYLFGHSDCPICDDHVAEYRASMINGRREWSEEELKLVAIEPAREEVRL